jgi:hypothetical protein
MTLLEEENSLLQRFGLNYGSLYPTEQSSWGYGTFGHRTHVSTASVDSYVKAYRFMEQEMERKYPKEMALSLEELQRKCNELISKKNQREKFEIANMNERDKAFGKNLFTAENDSTLFKLWECLVCKRNAPEIVIGRC